MVDRHIDNIARTLLGIGWLVADVCADGTINYLWKQDNGHNGFPVSGLQVGINLGGIGGHPVFAEMAVKVAEVFRTGSNTCLSYTSDDSNSQDIIRILNSHPTPGHVFVLIESKDVQVASAITEDKWKLALDASGDGMWDLDVVSGKMSFSDQWRRIFGYTEDEITTVGEWLNILHPDDNIAAHEAMSKYYAGATTVYSAELRYRCKDGNYKWILSRGVVVSRDDKGGVLRMIGTHKDINQRKMAEAELKVSRETFANLFNFSAIGKALLGPGGVWLEVNDVVCKMTGYTRDELVKLHYRDITFEDDVDLDMPYVQKLVAGEIDNYTLEKRYVSKTRRIITTLLTVSIVRNADNSPKYFICDIVDISEKKELSQELAHKNAELETATMSLMGKITQLEELNSIIAHNLRGPAGNIKLLAEESEMFGREQALALIRDASITLLDELNVLLELSRIRLNRDIPYETCNFRKIGEGVMIHFLADIYQKHVDLVFDIEVEEIVYPKVYLESILYNLISNAIKYCRTDIQPRIVVSTRKIGDEVRLSVKDNGLGIDMDRFADRVFKLNQVFHEGYDSKGVGLFMTRAQIESTGGHIELHSKLNEGSEFIVAF